MVSYACTIVPPHVLRGIAFSNHPEVSAKQRDVAKRSLDHQAILMAKRTRRIDLFTVPHSQRRGSDSSPHGFGLEQRHTNVPSILLNSMPQSGAVDDAAKARVKRDHDNAEIIQSKRRQSLASEAAFGVQSPVEPEEDVAENKLVEGVIFKLAAYNANHTDNENNLPGKELRCTGGKTCGDGPANEAFENVNHVLNFYYQVFAWKSIDNQNMEVLSSVHFSTDYENAFWDPEKSQMVFGDGHDFLHHFTKCVDVIGHELTHAVTQHTSPLDYQNQSGALNEHVSDVFGIMIKQRVEKKTAEQSDWLIGEGCLLPEVKGTALRSMKAPGTAYDDARFGKDPQPADMSGYAVTEEDNGGVHIYSGIPNRAFYLSAVNFGGYAWEKAGKVWWRAMSSGKVPPNCTFLQFADVTTSAAEDLFGEEGRKIVRGAWDSVGVVGKA